MSKRNWILVGAGVAIVVILFIVGQRLLAPAPANQAATSATASSAVKESLGGQIYSEIQNPLQNKMPDANPVKNANPIQGLYTNPL